MKFIHVADVHLDSQTIGLKNFYGQSPLSIPELVQKAFVSLIDLAIEQSVDFIIIAGDLFDCNWKDYAIGLFFINQIQRLNCPIYYIRGNHDSENRLLKSLPYPNHFYLFESEKPQTIINEGLKIAVHGQSYGHYHIQEDLTVEYPSALKGYFNIGILHTSGSKKNGELPYAPYDEYSLKSKNYDYWALGHLHQNQIVTTSPFIIYSGSIQGRQVKELGVKGCYLITVEDQEVKKIDFCPLSTAIWQKKEINLTEVRHLSSLKIVFLQLLDALLKETKEPILILRLIFNGENRLEKSISAHLEEWMHTFYCWIAEHTTRKVYLERLVDLSKTKSNKSEDSLNSFARPFLDDITSEEKKEAVMSLCTKGWEALSKKIPEEVFRLDPLYDYQDGFDNELKHYLESLFTEVRP